MDNSTKDEKNTAFIIWTPLHLFNVLRFIISRDLTGKCDAFYMCQSDGMERYYRGLQESGIFRNIYYSTLDVLKHRQHLWEISFGLFRPSLYVRHIFNKKAINNQYDELFMSVPTRLNDAIVRSNDCKEIVGFDDGIGSYISNLYGVSLGRKYDLARKTFIGDYYKIGKAYLNNSEIVDRADGIVYNKLLSRELTEEENGVMKKIFHFTPKEDDNRYIYLNQPLEEMTADQGYRDVEEKIAQSLKQEFCSELSVRMHPREKDESFYEGIKIEDNTQMWEILCSEKSMDEKVLISVFSTAQFTPKLLFNKEPYIVFTLYLYPGFPEETIDKYMSLVFLLRNSYVNKERIIIPRTFEEYMTAIQQLKQRVS